MAGSRKACFRKDPSNSHACSFHSAKDLMNMKDVVVGIDIGGTNSTLGLVDREGEILQQTTIPTQGEEEAPRLVKRLYDALQTMNTPRNNWQIKGVGIGAPNANYYHGTVEYPPNLNWKGVTNVVGLFHEYTNLPVVITNDANAAAMGEMVFGAGKGLKDFIVITLGTGLGSGLVVNGALVYGHDGFAGEIGHMTVDPNGRECGCGRRGCLETYCSATGICRTVFELLCNRRAESELRTVSFRDLTAKMVSEAAHRGDPIAREAFEITGQILGMKLADSVVHTSPEAIILFGGLASAGELIFEPTKRHLETHLLNIFKGKVKLLPSGLKERSVAVLGSAALIWNELEKRK
jgi:glucokinase